MNVKIVCVGKLKEAYLRDAAAEYSKRIKRYCGFEIRELDEFRLPEKPSAREIEKALDAEGKNILKECKGYRAALCIEGGQLGSTQFADMLYDAGIRGQGNVTFIIGSSYGLSEEVKKAANMRLSMSAMTFPHQLARVMLAEQIYRAFQIKNNGKYHK